MKRKLEISAHLCGMALVILLTVLTLSGVSTRGKIAHASPMAAAAQPAEGCSSGGCGGSCHTVYYGCDGAQCGSCGPGCPDPDACCSADVGYCEGGGGTCWVAICSGTWCICD